LIAGCGIALFACHQEKTIVGQLIVRNLDDDIVRRLKMQAAKHGRSAEAEHREILTRALRPDAAGGLKSLLREMPPIGDDADFEHRRELARPVDLT
jgi:plasmid stability protein